MAQQDRMAAAHYTSGYIPICATVQLPKWSLYFPRFTPVYGVGGLLFSFTLTRSALQDNDV
jgi:hypothetical protein